MQYLRNKLLALYQGMQRLSRGRLDVFTESVKRFVGMLGLETAATLAYYDLFSMVPLILVLVAVLGYL